MFKQDVIIYCHIDVKWRSQILHNSDHPAYLFEVSSKAFEINLLSKFLCPWNIKVILMFINFFLFFSDGFESKTSSSQIFYSRKVGILYIILLWNSQNREHQKYLWNVIVLRQVSQ